VLRLGYCDVTRGPRPDSPWPSHIKYTTMVGITKCIVIRLQESVVACVLQPWSGGKDPDRYTHGWCYLSPSKTLWFYPLTPSWRHPGSRCQSILLMRQHYRRKAEIGAESFSLLREVPPFDCLAFNLINCFSFLACLGCAFIKLKRHSVNQFKVT
jgi:hypothetical protein